MNKKKPTLEEILSKFMQSAKPCVQRVYKNENGQWVDEPLRPYYVHDNGDISDYDETDDKP